MNDRNNTIAGWVLAAGIVALGASIVTGELFHAEAPEEGGYPVEGAAEGEGGGAAEQPIEVFLAKADVAKGQSLFNKCAACHTINQGGANGLGPNLWGVMGEEIGKGHGFAFSPALSGHGGTWNWDTLNQWLKSPRAFAQGTKMTFAGLGSEQDRADIIAYLNSMGPSPLPLPAAPAPEAAAPAEGDAAAAPADGNAEAPADANAAAPAPAEAPAT